MYILREQSKSDTTDNGTQLLWLYKGSFRLGVVKHITPYLMQGRLHDSYNSRPVTWNVLRFTVVKY